MNDLGASYDRQGQLERLDNQGLRPLTTSGRGYSIREATEAGR